MPHNEFRTSWQTLGRCPFAVKQYWRHGSTWQIRSGGLNSNSMEGRKHPGHNEDSESRANAKVGPQEATRSRKWTYILKFGARRCISKVVSGLELGLELLSRRESREISKSNLQCNANREWKNCKCSVKLSTYYCSGKPLKPDHETNVVSREEHNLSHKGVLKMRKYSVALISDGESSNGVKPLGENVSRDIRYCYTNGQRFV